LKLKEQKEKEEQERINKIAADVKEFETRVRDRHQA
jgi:hypothetical protein